MRKIKPIKKTVAQIKKVSKQKPLSPRKVDPNSLIPTPCVPFNLECSGRHEGAFQLGKVVNLIGDSHSGKTLFALSTLAECAYNPRFNDYDLILDDVETANEFDIAYLFGKKTYDRINTDIRSHLIEDFNDNIARALAGDKPFIYVLDSFDALSSEQSIKLDASNRTKREKGNKTDAQYNDGKARVLTEFFTLRIQDLKAKESAVIIISQTRDNLGFGAMFNPKRRAGGKALKFFSCHEIWLAMQKKEKVGKRTFITNVQAKITKNKVTGNHGEAFFPIMYDYGVDNIASCIKFMVEEGNWTGTKTSLNTKGFYPDGNIKYSALIEWIEGNNKEEELAICCQDAYDEVMASLKPNRKRKY